MPTCSLGPTSLVHIRPFAALQEVAVATFPSLQKGTIAFSGGSTYNRLFDLWAAMPYNGSASFFPVDERKVPFTDPASNWGNACRRLLTPWKRTRECRHHPGDACAYESLLKKAFGKGPPAFSTLFLGMGADGHTASLFPGSSLLDDMHSLILETRSPLPPHDRITIGPRLIRAAHTCVVVIPKDPSKKALVTRLLHADCSFPLSFLLSRRRQSTVYIHEELL